MCCNSPYLSCTSVLTGFVTRIETDAMATSSKFDLSSGSPDRPLYTSGQRGSHMTASLERSGSFRESMESPVLSSLPSMSRSAIAQEDVTNFFQCVRFDPKTVAAEHKSNRQGDLKRLVNVALSISPDDSPSSSVKGKLLPPPLPEDVKQVKAVLRESCVKARERANIFNEALSVFNKVFPSVPSKKRSRTESYSNERSGVVLPGDRSMMGPSMGKIGIQNHVVAGGFELDQQKSEERTKSYVPNKRTRTSLVDVRMDARNNALVRPSGVVEREMMRLASSGAVQGEENNLTVGVDGWEKSKMKKKRTGIKSDVTPMATSKSIDGYREVKQGMQPRPGNDSRSRLNNDSHGFRPGVANGAVGVGKLDGITQPTGPFRSSILKIEPDNPSLINDKRDRPMGPDKERGNQRTINKSNARDDFNSASPTSSTKINATVRAPRSGSAITPKLSPVVHRATLPNDWEISQCSNKPTAVVGANNRKRMTSARSSSPPVAQWAGQRPQKMSRTARRSNFNLTVPSNEETPSLDSRSDVTGSDIGQGFARRLPGSSHQQVKLKVEPLSSAAVSESEETGAAEIKSRDKGKRSDEIDEKPGQNIQTQKVPSLIMSSKKQKLAAGEDLGDGVRRQGRTGRGFSSTRSLVPMSVEKMGNVGTAKQLGSSKFGVDKSESKAGRPPTRRLSDRKGYTRQKHTAVNPAADFLVGSDDGHEELMTAVKAVIASAHSFSSPFWRQMEPFFGFLSDADIDYVKGNIKSTQTIPAEVPCSSDSNHTVHYGHGSSEFQLMSGRFCSEQSSIGTGDPSEIPLCQRLIAALISEEDFSSGNEDPMFDAYGDSDLDAEFESYGLNSQFQVNFQFAGKAASNGYRITGRPEHDETEGGICIPNRTSSPNYGLSENGVLPDQGIFSGFASSDYQYGNLHINEKILLEVQSIGIYPELLPDMTQTEDDGISAEIRKLEEKYHEQVSNKKELLDGLWRSASEKKECQTKDLEQLALDKLVGMAYQKYLACWGPNATGGKSSSNKMAKQAALAFVRRTLDQCHKFEETGTSCFDEPVFRDILLSVASDANGIRQSEAIGDGESTKSYASTRCLEGNLSASMGSKQHHPQFSQNIDNSITSSDVLPPLNHLSEQSMGRQETWTNRVKKRELSLDDVVNTIGTSNSPSGIGNSLSSSAKGKRSERDRDGKGQNREVLSRNGTAKIGWPALSNVKGERKSKTKPKQKTAQLSVSLNGPVGKISEHPKTALHPVPKSSENTTSRNSKQKDQFPVEALENPIDLSHLPLPGMDVLGADDIDDQGLCSWFNINDDVKEDDGLQDQDDIGEEGFIIPMDEAYFNII